MTTEGSPGSGGRRPTRRRRPRPAVVARVLTTGAALSATGALVALMGAADRAESDPITADPGPVAAPAASPAPSPPATVIVVRQAPLPTSSTAVAPPPAPVATTATQPASSTAPSAGVAQPAPVPTTVPPPVVTSTPS